MISRRELLTGAGGFVIATGATTAGAAALRPSTPSIPAVSPTEELMYDHGVLKRLLLCYREMSRLLSTGHALPANSLNNSAQLIRDYVESYHEGLEETYVFPRLRNAGQHTDVVNTLLIQHDRGRWLTTSLLNMAADGIDSATARTAAQNTLDSFVRMYDPHEAWEDTLIFPAFRKVTPDRTWRLLAEQFASEQDRLFGTNTMAHIIEQVSAIESDLSIGDLNSFTAQVES